MKLTFEKEKDNNWYVVLPEWKGSQSDLQMVMGADILLDILLDDGNSFVILEVSLDPIDNYEHLKLIELPDFGGGLYILEMYNNVDIDLEVWICDVIKHIFNGNIPNNIYFKKI